MDSEEKNIDQNESDLELKNAVSNELSSYINPYSRFSVSSKQLPNQKVGVGQQNLAGTRPQASSLSKPIIRTYKSDVEEAIQSSHLSSINIALAENKRMMERIQTAEQIKGTEKKNYTILILSAVLVIGGILAFSVPYYLVNQQYAEEETTEIVFSGAVITADSEEKIDVGGLNTNRIAVTLAERVEQSSIPLGSIKNFYLTEFQNQKEALINSEKFLSLTKMHQPADITRTLKPEYMFGMHNYNGSNRFLILKVGSYENAFTGMLTWEIDLWSDFKELFGLSSKETSNFTNSSGVFGSETKTFQDAIYGNKDTRVVKDSSGNVLLLYSIIDKNTIVITTSSDTLREIISRNIKAQSVTQ